MQFFRLFSPDAYKGTCHYLKTQKKYEVIRTVLYFAISFSLFLAGYAATRTKVNLLTIVAVLGCLPASKSAVQMIMYLRYKSLSETAYQKILPYTEGLYSLYDLVFTSYRANFAIGHMMLHQKLILGYTEDKNFDEKAFYDHLDSILKKEGYKNYTIKIFRDIDKYTERLSEVQKLSAKEDSITEALAVSLKSISL